MYCHDNTEFSQIKGIKKSPPIAVLFCPAIWAPLTCLQRLLTLSVCVLHFVLHKPKWGGPAFTLNTWSDCETRNKKEWRIRNQEESNKSALVIVFFVVIPKPVMALVIEVAWIFQKIDNNPGLKSVLSPGRSYHTSSLDLACFPSGLT